MTRGQARAYGKKAKLGAMIFSFLALARDAARTATSEGGGPPHGLLRALQGGNLGRCDLGFFYDYRHNVAAVLAFSCSGLIPPVLVIP